MVRAESDIYSMMLSQAPRTRSIIVILYSFAYLGGSAKKTMDILAETGVVSE